jgi:hypothetical protein
MRLHPTVGVACRSSLFFDSTIRIWAKPAIGTAPIFDSTPPQMAMSASPATI